MEPAGPKEPKVVDVNKTDYEIFMEIFGADEPKIELMGDLWNDDSSLSLIHACNIDHM